MTNESASPTAPLLQPLGVQFDLNTKEAEALKGLIGEDDCVGEISLSVGDGHAGYGLYAWQTDYPEEGSTFLQAAPLPPGEIAGARPTDEKPSAVLNPVSAVAVQAAWVERAMELTLAVLTRRFGRASEKRSGRSTWNRCTR